MNVGVSKITDVEMIGVEVPETKDVETGDVEVSEMIDA